MAAVEAEMECVDELRRRARTEIEIEEQINKGNQFSPDIGLHADVALLSGSVHLRHNAPVSSAHATFTLNKRCSLYDTEPLSGGRHTQCRAFCSVMGLNVISAPVLPLTISHGAHFLNRRENQVR